MDTSVFDTLYVKLSIWWDSFDSEWATEDSTEVVMQRLPNGQEVFNNMGPDLGPEPSRRRVIWLKVLFRRIFIICHVNGD